MTAPQPSLRSRGPLVRSISGGVLDAGFASLGTFAVGIVAARYLDPAALGAYALFFAAFTALTVFATEGIFVPAEARSVSRPVNDRRHIVRQAVPVGLGSTIVVLPGLLIAYFLVPDSVPQSITVPLAITTAATVIVAPLQEHVRRVCHLARISWRASVVSMVQFVVIVASLLSMLAMDVAVAWIPFGALAIANTFSLVVGLVLLAYDRRGELGLRLTAGDLVRSGRWLVTAAFIRSGSAFVAAALIARLASAEALGYAEAARVIGRPVLVIAMGLEAVLGPRSVEAALDHDRTRARRISTGFVAILAATAVPYMLLVRMGLGMEPGTGADPHRLCPRRAGAPPGGLRVPRRCGGPLSHGADRRPQGSGAPRSRGGRSRAAGGGGSRRRDDRRLRPPHRCPGHEVGAARRLPGGGRAHLPEPRRSRPDRPVRGRRRYPAPSRFRSRPVTMGALSTCSIVVSSTSGRVAAYSWNSFGMLLKRATPPGTRWGSTVSSS